MQSREINVTNDYSIFKKLQGNRNVAASRIGMIKKSIQDNGWMSVPILVNEKMEIIDGQARFYALKALNMPIEFIVNAGRDISDCIILNKKQENWKLNDYVVSFAEQGNENYIKLLKLFDEYKDIPKSTVMSVCAGRYRKLGIDTVKLGDFVFSKEEKQAICELDFIRRIKGASLTSGSIRIRFLNAVMFCLYCGVDKDRMEKVINSSNIPPYNNIESYVNFLENIYNARLPTEKRFSLAFEYKKQTALENKARMIKSIERKQNGINK